jgi:predicted regulator of Ras-like GTPase activity (Roadblock/LC7/MglB family)
MTDDEKRNLRDEILKTAVSQLSPIPEWAVISHGDGLIMAAYTRKSETPQLDITRIALVSRGVLSWIKRPSTDLSSGMINEWVVYGSEAIFIMTEINEDWLLSTKFVSISSLDEIHAQLQKTVVEMNKLLKHLT